MKQKLTGLLALLLLLTASGCGADRSAAESPAETVPAETTVLTETTAVTTAETTAETTADTAAAAETTAETTDSAADQTDVTRTTRTQDENAPAVTGGRLTDQLSAKLAAWDRGDIVLRCGYEEMGMQTDVTVMQFEGRQYMSMQMSGIELITLYDGTHYYLLEPKSSTYSVGDDEEGIGDNELSVVQQLLEETGSGKFNGTGQEQYRGQNAVYEEFLLDDTTAEPVLGRFYFVSENLIGFKLSQGEESMDVDYRIEFREDTDSSVYAVPSGYREITADEMNEQIISLLSESLGDLEGLFGTELPDE